MARRFAPEKLEAAMERLGVSKKELGRRLNPDNPEGGRVHVIKLLPLKDEQGRVIRAAIYTKPQRKTVERLAAALGVTVEAITDPDPLAERIKGLRERQDARRAA